MASVGSSAIEKSFVRRVGTDSSSDFDEWDDCSSESENSFFVTEADRLDCLKEVAGLRPEPRPELERVRPMVNFDCWW